MIARMHHGRLEACGTHDKQRTHSKPIRPRNRCSVCWLVYLADQLETVLYQDDMEAMMKFAGKTDKIAYEETCDADV